MTQHTDVLIIGGGIAGIAAARLAKTANGTYITERYLTCF